VAKAIARWGVRRGPFTKALENGDPYLQDLGAWYRHNAPEIGVQTKVYYENAGVKVVDKESANPGVSNVEATELDGDHFSICKPESRNDHYRILLSNIQKAIQGCPVFKETHLSVLDVGKRFECLAELPAADRAAAVKKVVQPIEVRLGRKDKVEYELSAAGKGDFVVSVWQEQAAATSSYDLDRIILNVWYQYRAGKPGADSAAAVRREKERLTSTGLSDSGRLSLMPLYYAARSLKIRKENNKVQLEQAARDDVQEAINLVENLAAKFGMDEDKSTRNGLNRCLQ